MYPYDKQFSAEYTSTTLLLTNSSKLTNDATIKTYRRDFALAAVPFGLRGIRVIDV